MVHCTLDHSAAVFTNVVDDESIQADAAETHAKHLTDACADSDVVIDWQLH